MMQCGLGPDSALSSQPHPWTLFQIFEQIQIFTTSGLYEFPKAAVTNYHTFDGLKQQKFISSEFWGDNSELKYPKLIILQIKKLEFGKYSELQKPFPFCCLQN